MKGDNMKKEYNLKTLKRRSPKTRATPDAVKVPVSIRLDGSVLAALKTEAASLGLPYQTLVGSVLHQYVTGSLVPAKSMAIWKKSRAS